jgi:hypothetical protein
MKGTEIGERGRSRRALWQMGPSVKESNAAIVVACGGGLDLIPDVVRRRIAAQAGEDAGDDFGVAKEAKDGLDSRSDDGRKEIVEIDFQDDLFGDVRRGKRFH